MSSMQSVARVTPEALSTAIESGEPARATLLDLVRSVSDVTDDEAEIVATVVHMLKSGRVRLCGNFRGRSVDEFTR